ncbi:uncharacterized protein LOC143026008 [Oratosquilla oratoria]|uniref:uncharacterized protein LOC143026008 n=1 Tax=Oratosquilla oratoria TaxID=337810 RepID=UPI003F773692
MMTVIRFVLVVVVSACSSSLPVLPRSPNVPPPPPSPPTPPPPPTASALRPRDSELVISSVRNQLLESLLQGSSFVLPRTLLDHLDPKELYQHRQSQELLRERQQASLLRRQQEFLRHLQKQDQEEEEEEEEEEERRRVSQHPRQDVSKSFPADFLSSNQTKPFSFSLQDGQFLRNLKKSLEDVYDQNENQLRERTGTVEEGIDEDLLTSVLHESRRDPGEEFQTREILEDPQPIPKEQQSLLETPQTVKDIPPQPEILTMISQAQAQRYPELLKKKGEETSVSLLPVRPRVLSVAHQSPENRLLLDSLLLAMAQAYGPSQALHSPSSNSSSSSSAYLPSHFQSSNRSLYPSLSLYASLREGQNRWKEAMDDGTSEEYEGERDDKLDEQERATTRNSKLRGRYNQNDIYVVGQPKKRQLNLGSRKWIVEDVLDIRLARCSMGNH